MCSCSAGQLALLMRNAVGRWVRLFLNCGLSSAPFVVCGVFTNRDYYTMSRRSSIGKKGSKLLPEGKPKRWESVADTKEKEGHVLIAHASPPQKKIVPTRPAPRNNNGIGISAAKNTTTKSTKSTTPIKNTAFDRLYQKGKEQSERRVLRANIKFKRPPVGCTFAPITNTIQTAIPPLKPHQHVHEILTSIIGAVETIGQSHIGTEQSRDLLTTEYESRMLDYQLERQEMARIATKRQSDTFENLFKNGQVKLEEKLKKVKEFEEKIPVDCTFQPMLSPPAKRKGGTIDGTKTKYMERATMNVKQNGKVKRTDLLYAERFDEREKKKRGVTFETCGGCKVCNEKSIRSTN